MGAWSDWCMQAAVDVCLLCGRQRALGCGAEQGDPEGCLKSAAVLAGVLARTDAARARTSGGRG
eukprot:1177242-Lingulodinium_polyedra.AAC.1